MARIDSFVFYRSFYEAIKELPDTDRLNVFDSICEYALDHNEIERTPVARGMMTLITPLLDANYKRRANGSQGGRPKTAQSSEELEDKADNQGIKPNLDETKTKPSQNQSTTKGEPNVNVNANVNGNVKDKKENTKEKRPTLDEVRSYCLERGNTVDPQRWYDYYSANGWKVGKNPMKDWKACIRTWERNTNVSTTSRRNESDTLPTYSTDKNKSLSNEDEQELLKLMGRSA